MRQCRATYPKMNEMPIGCVPIVRAVLTHRGNENSVREGDIAEGQRFEQSGQVLILRECFLHQLSATPAALNTRLATHRWECAPDLRIVQRVEGIHS
jgi:hypothetical protein